MHIFRWAGFLLVVLAATATAQDTTTDQETELPEYQVEMIVVRHLNPSTGTELFPMIVDLEESEAPVQRFIPMDPAEFALSDMATRIGRSRNFRVLTHTGWNQPGYGREDARRKLVMRSAGTGEVVSGHAVLMRGRYLRLALDLTLQVDGETYHLDDQRRMISRQVHYFDNPHFGVIAKITPL